MDDEKIIKFITSDKFKLYLKNIQERPEEYLIEDPYEAEVKDLAYRQKIIYNTYCNVGFTEEQAFQLLLNVK